MIDELEKLARAATPGPWSWDNSDETRNELNAPHRMLFKEGFAPTAGDPTFDDFLTEDVQYIAAANPDTVLKLIAVVRGAQAYQASKVQNGEPMWPESWDDEELMKALEALNDTR